MTTAAKDLDCGTPHGQYVCGTKKHVLLIGTALCTHMMKQYITPSVTYNLIDTSCFTILLAQYLFPLSPETELHPTTASLPAPTICSIHNLLQNNHIVQSQSYDGHPSRALRSLALLAARGM